MIFVTLGNHNQPFYRLLKKIDELARDKAVRDVTVQVGYSDFEMKYCAFRKFVEMNEFTELIKKSDFVISHAGAGTIQTAFSCGKPIIVVPRLKQYGEHTNDHQLEITRAMEAEDRIIAVYDTNKLAEAIAKAQYFKPKSSRCMDGIISIINNYLYSLNTIRG